MRATTLQGVASPLFWFTDDTATIMHGGLLIGAALGGIGPLLVLARLQRGRLHTARQGLARLAGRPA